MERIKATQIAYDLVKKLEPFCDRIEIAGSIRRKKHQVHDIDIVAIPNEDMLMKAGLMSTMSLIPHLCDKPTDIINGQKLASFKYKGAPVDIYWASPGNWATLLLIRTGSKQSNIRLCQLAIKQGWKLHADGQGLFDETGQRIAGDSEVSIFEALGIPYLEPERRE